MAPRQPGHGQLDEISEAIGIVKGKLEGIERYMHEREHGLNNLMQKVEGLGVRITRDIAAVEGRIEGRIKAMDDRLLALERAQARDTGARNVITAILRSPAIGWLVGAAISAWAILTGKVHLP
jgi:hypothetical protein